MSGLSFIASLVQSLAWPAATVTVVLLFRKQIKALLSQQVSRFKAGPVEMEWERRVVQVETLVEPAPRQVAATGSALLADLDDVIEKAPDRAVLAAFDRITERLRPYLPQDGPEPERPYSRLGDKLRSAVAAGGVSPETARAVEGLLALRNLVAHGQARENKITATRAREYAAMADAVIFALPPRKAG